MKNKILAVDMDGTLTKDICWTVSECLKAKPNQKMIDFINYIYERGGYEIIIYTARKVSLKRATEKWLKEVGLKYHKYGPRKMVYDWLFDDHAYKPSELI